VTLLEINTGNYTMLSGSDITIQGSSIAFTDGEIATNQHYNVTVMASSNGNPFTHRFSISEFIVHTHYA
jgi:hypothetical protein